MLLRGRCRVCHTGISIEYPLVELAGLGIWLGVAWLYGPSWTGLAVEPVGGAPHFRHIGVYAFRADFLRIFTGLPSTPGECAERLEQLRILEHGYSIGVLETDYRGRGVDTPGDLETARRLAEGKT